MPPGGIMWIISRERASGRPVKMIRSNLNEVEWANGSRVVSLPDNPHGVVGFTPTRVVIDEASRVSDELYMSLRPMLALGAHQDAISRMSEGAEHEEAWF